MQTRSVRTLRGACAAAVATWTAAVSHTLGGGSAPSPLLLFVVTALALPFAVALAGRRPGLARLTATVAGAQILFHVAFASTAHIGGTATGHVHGRYAPLGGGRAASFVPDVDMLVAHIAAGILTLVLLAYGERLLRALGRGIAKLFGFPPDIIVVALRRSGRAVAASPVAMRRLALASHFSRRGPPALVVAA